jgi:DNA-binding transcriptional MocR family regulator
MATSNPPLAAAIRISQTAWTAASPWRPTGRRKVGAVDGVMTIRAVAMPGGLRWSGGTTNANWEATDVIFFTIPSSATRRFGKGAVGQLSDKYSWWVGKTVLVDDAVNCNCRRTSMRASSSGMKTTVMRAAGVPGAADTGCLYAALAGRLAAMIESGAFRAGDRVPSVRKVSLQESVSITTVLQAYRTLEDKGLIEARPQSGYYVKPRVWRPPAEPEVSRPVRGASLVDVNALIMRVMYSHVALEAAQRPDLRYVNLGSASPNPALLPTAALNRRLAAVARAQSAVAHQCSAPDGDIRLRTQIARRAMEAGCTLSPGEIIITNGAQEALYLCLRAVTEPGDTVAVESPTYYGILQVIESLGLKACEVPTYPREGVCLVELKERLDECDIKACVFVPNYSNPLGGCMPDAKKAALAEMLAERGIPLIEDDVFGEITHDTRRPKVVKAFDRRGLVMTCDSFAKSLAPGYRLGWVVASGPLLERVRQLKFVTSAGTARLPQLAAADYLAHGGYDHHLRKIRRAYAAQVQEYGEAIVKAFPAGTRVTRPSGGWILWVEMPAGVDSLALTEAALASKITVAPGPIFSANRRFQNFIRICCGPSWDDRTAAAIERLGRIAADLAAGGVEEQARLPVIGRHRCAAG